MTTPADGAGQRRDHGCQTPGCPNDVNVITVRMDDSEVTMLCEGCQLAFNLAVLQKLSEQGLISAPGAGGVPAGASPPAPVV